MTRFNPPIHPGEVLREEFLVPLRLKPYTLAKRLHVQRARIERIVAETHPVSPDTALRLARFFGTTAEFWMNMQASYDLAINAATYGQQIEAIEPLKAA